MFFCSLGLEGHSCKLDNAPNLTGKRQNQWKSTLITQEELEAHTLLSGFCQKLFIQIQTNCYTNTKKIVIQIQFFIQIHKKLLYKYNKKLYDTWKMKNITFSLCLFTLLWQQWTLGPPCISFSFYICYSGNFIFAIGAIET